MRAKGVGTGSIVDSPSKEEKSAEKAPAAEEKTAKAAKSKAASLAKAASEDKPVPDELF